MYLFVLPSGAVGQSNGVLSLAAVSQLHAGDY